MQCNKVPGTHFKFDRKSMETDTTTWSDFHNGRKAIVEQKLASEVKNKSKTAGISQGSK